MPGQGIFIGEPLANPFKGYTVAVSDDSVSILTRTLSPGRYVILGAKFPVGPYRKPVTTFGVTGHGIQRFTIPKTNDKYYRVLRINPPNTPVSG
jgi:hypothetical protein